MVKTPIFKLLANNQDITTTIKENLVSITIKDEANSQADELTLKVTGKVARPQYKDELKIYLGYDDAISFMGLFLVQTTTRENNYGLTISATGVNFSASLKEKRNITYEKISMKDICTQIAKRNSLKVSCDMGDIYFMSLAQQNESDLHFLNREARELNAIFNIKNDTLVFKKKIKNSKKSDELPSYTIDVNICSHINIKHSNRTFYKCAKAIWHDTKENKVKQVLAGSGTPVYVFKGNFKNSAEAKIKAEAKLQIANQGIVSGSLSIPGEIIFAGGVLNIKNSLEDDGEYQIKSVTHTLNESGWKTNLEFER